MFPYAGVEMPTTILSILQTNDTKPEHGNFYYIRPA